LSGQVAGHEVHVVGEVFPRATYARDLRLASQLAFGADLASDARHFAREGVQLIDHRVDGVLQFENLALHVHGDLAGQITPRHSSRHFGNVADLRGEIASHCVDRVSEVFPRSRHTGHNCLASQFAVGADLASDARHLGCEGPQLVHHRIDSFLEL